MIESTSFIVVLLKACCRFAIGSGLSLKTNIFMMPGRNGEKGRNIQKKKLHLSANTRRPSPLPSVQHLTSVLFAKSSPLQLPGACPVLFAKTSPLQHLATVLSLDRQRPYHPASNNTSMGYAGATKVLLLKNARLSYRDWGSLLIQVLATFVAIAILKLSQVGTDNNSFAPELKSDLRPEATPVPTIPRCIALETDSCITLAYAPSADARVKRYVDAVAKGAGIPADEVQGHAGSAELNKELLARPNRTQAAYVFEDEDLDALTDGNVRFIVQVNLTEQANFPIGKSKHTELIVAPAMLHAMNSVMFGELSEGEMDVKLSLSVFSHPDLPGIQDAFTEDGPLLLYGVYFISFVLFLYKIVDEKERGMRDYMKLSGLAQSQHYISWGLPFLAFFLVQTLLIIAFGAMFRFRFFTETNFLVYFFTLFLFGFALVGWVFLFEVLIKRTRQVPTISFNFFILSYLISSAGSVVYVEDADGEPVVGGNIVYTLRKVFACLPSTVFTKCIRDISQRAATGFGMSFSQASSYTDVFPITTCWLWMLGSGVVALLLAMYFDNIVSTPNGVGLSPLYLFTPSYWGFGADKEALVSRGENVGSDKDGSSANEGDEPVAAPVQSVDSVEGTYDESREDGDVRREREAIESRARDHRPLVIKNLVKRYGKLNAVDGLNLSVPRNTVTAVLGPKYVYMIYFHRSSHLEYAKCHCLLSDTRFLTLLILYYLSCLLSSASLIFATT